MEEKQLAEKLKKNCPEIMDTLEKAVFVITSQQILDEVRELNNAIEEYGYTNKQWYLDFLDELNKESVRH